MILKNPRVLDAFTSDVNINSDAVVSSVDVERIEDDSSALTDREKEIFLLNKAQLYSYDEIADLLQVKKYPAGGSETVKTNE